MKLITYQHDNHTLFGAVAAETAVNLSHIAPDMLAFIEQGPTALQQATAYLQTNPSGIPLAQVRLLAPIPNPRRNIMCLGLNYAEHVAESYSTRGQAVQLPEFPIIFTKATTSINSPTDPIPYDAQVTQELDWEVELAVIIGKAGKNIRAANAYDYIFGYSVLNDITARDLQRHHKQFFKGKSLDGACPMGPWLVTAVDLPTPHNLHITCRVNGLTKQDSNTQHMIFQLPTIIEHLSRGMTLLPGDIIATGTPDGVGFARQPAEFLHPGDVVECEIEGIGTIRNPITQS